MGDTTGDEDRWRARPGIAAVVVLAVFAIPVVCSIAVAALVGHLWSPAASVGHALERWAAILGASTVAFVGCERLTRRALPLSVLLKMGMAFPGRAPRRLSVARRSWTTRDLSRRIDDARVHGITDEPTAAAEQIVALAATLSAHDRKTRGHAERVRAFTDLIAEELRLPEEDRDRLRWSALLHDVGKLTVHSDILNKPGALSDEEWELMRQHPLEGAKLTAPLAAWLGPWANTIAEHHERFDGKGYPFGLADHEISLGGRIVAVADCYDTMTSLRSYKKPLSAEVARAELAACAGAQFDPVIVRAFLAVSVSRLHAVAPLTWIGSLPFGNLGPQLAQIAAAGGRIGVTGVAAGIGVVGLTAGPSAGTTATSTPTGSHASAAKATTPRTASPSAAGSGQGQTGTTGGGASSSGPRTTVEPGKAGQRPAGTGTTGPSGTGPIGGTTPAGDQAGGGTDGTVPSGDAAPTSTVVPGSNPPGPTTTVSGTTPPRSTTTTTTTAPLAPLVAPSAVHASPSCQALILLPKVTLTWTASPTLRVTGYRILRSTSATSGFVAIATVAGRTTSSYEDTTASGLGTKYWYEIEADASGATATSTSASATTPPLCL
jgi:hypothetical protein